MYSFMNAHLRRVRKGGEAYYNLIDDSDRVLGILLLLPPILLFGTISLFPIIFGVWMSFHSGMELANLQFVGLSNYNNIFDDVIFLSSIKLGFIYAVYSVFIQLILGVAIALMLNRKFRFGNLVRTIVLLPYLIPTVAVAFVFQWLLNNQWGLVNYLIIFLGLTDRPVEFFDSTLAMHSVVWVSGWKFTIFVVLIILARLQSIDETLYQAAKVNGANTVRQFLDVTWPNIKNAVILVVLLRGIWMFNKFDMIWLLTRGGPFQETTTMVIYAYRKGILEYNIGEGAAITVVIFITLIIVAIIYFSQFNPEEEVDVQ